MINKKDLIPITNDIMFSLVMEDPEISKGFLRLLFPDKEIGEIRVSTQHDMTNGLTVKSVRLDVFIIGQEEWWNVEMQCSHHRNLPYRSRYYRSSMDIRMIEKGQPYEDLKKSYIIFLCTFDPFGQGLPVYSFQMCCNEKKSLLLGDESYIIMVNTKGRQDRLPEPMKAFFNYINAMALPDMACDTFVEKIHEKVVHFNESEWREQIMTVEQEIMLRERYAYKEGLEQGEKQGHKQGIKQGHKQGHEQGVKSTKISTAKAMKAENLSDDMICRITGLTIEEIAAL